MIGEDNFREDVSISPCVNCRWKYTDKCLRCINKNRKTKLEIWQPNKIMTTSSKKTSTTGVKQ